MERKNQVVVDQDKGESSNTFRTVLGTEYCSGYIDSYGKWNTGFYCPDSEQSGTIFCCGSDVNKFCCSIRERRAQEDVDALTVMIGVVVGASTALLLLIIVFLLYCSWCSCSELTYLGFHQLKGVDC